MKRVLIIEDEQDISELITLHLEDMNCQIMSFRDGREGYMYALKNAFDLMLLDINLPSMNGIEICKSLRANKVNSPILMLTARSEELDKVLGLETGADDYITKPFSIRELIARVKAMLRRVDIDTNTEESQIIVYREMYLDKSKRKVSIANQRIELTPKEFDLLYLMATNPGVTYDRKDLLNLVWGYDFEGYEHTVNSHINRLRSKIEKDPAAPEYVLTTWGVGYRFNDA